MDRTTVGSFGQADIHNGITHGNEGLRVLHLSKEVSQIVHGVNIRNTDLHIFHTFANEEMTTLDVFNTFVVLGVVRKITSSSIVATKLGRRVVTYTEFMSPRRWRASLAASDKAIISASQEERATDVCFVEAQLTEARWKRKTLPEVER